MSCAGRFFVEELKQKLTQLRGCHFCNRMGLLAVYVTKYLPVLEHFKPMRGVHMVKPQQRDCLCPRQHVQHAGSVFGLSIDYKSICGLADVNLLDAMSA